MSKKAIETNRAPKPVGPYNQAILAHQTLFVSGQIAIDPTGGEVVRGDIEEQTHQVMKNVLAVLSQAEMGVENIVKASIFLKDMDDFARVNKVYASYFNQTPPARECVEVSRLPKNVGIEISVIAVVL